MFEDSETNPPDAYCVYDKLPVVFIARRRPGAGRLRAQFQELGHHRRHYPNARFFISLDNKVEFWANIVAACALLPFPLPRSHDICRLEEEYSYSKKLIAIRAMLLQQLRSAPWKGSAMICLNCGIQLPKEAQICIQCGEQISTPGNIAYPGKNRKRASKSVIAITILGACACVLTAVAVLPEILKDRSQPQGQTTVTGGPALYSAPRPTPTTTPTPAPVRKAETYEIDTKAIGLQPDQLWWHPLLVKNDWRNARLVGKFIAQGGEKNDIEAIVTNEKGLINWRKNYLHRPEVWYKSGRVTEDTINVPLPTGQSYFVFSNRFSVPVNKTIRFNLRIEYERLAQP